MFTRLRAMTSRTSDGGFSLIELLVVVIIIGILSAIAVPMFLKQKERAADSAMVSDVRNAISEIETYYTVNYAYPNPTADGQPDMGEDFALSPSEGNTFNYSSGDTQRSFCIQSSTDKPSIAETVAFSNDPLSGELTGVVTEGATCDDGVAKPAA